MKLGPGPHSAIFLDGRITLPPWSPVETGMDRGPCESSQGGSCWQAHHMVLLHSATSLGLFPHNLSNSLDISFGQCY